MEEMNSGTTPSDCPSNTSTRSLKRPARIAAHTPPAMPNGTTSTKARAPSFTEFASASPTKGATGARKVKDRPMSPATKCLIQSQY